MNGLVRLCSVADLDEAEPLRVVIDDFPPLAVYCVDGAYYVTDDTCTHGMASLADGYQEGDEIECPYHGGVFNIKSGEPTSFPCTEAIRTYVVVEQAGDICIRAGADQRPSVNNSHERGEGR
jgi:ethylbenzene dioxygenase ferredoxin component